MQEGDEEQQSCTAPAAMDVANPNSEKQTKEDKNRVEEEAEAAKDGEGRKDRKIEEENEEDEGKIAGNEAQKEIDSRPCPSATTVENSNFNSNPNPNSNTVVSKRKWSPCTWRYAIEELQPELGSKPRAGAALQQQQQQQQQQQISSQVHGCRSGKNGGESSHGEQIVGSRRSPSRNGTMNSYYYYPPWEEEEDEDDNGGGPEARKHRRRRDFEEDRSSRKKRLQQQQQQQQQNLHQRAGEDAIKAQRQGRLLPSSSSSVYCAGRARTRASPDSEDLSRHVCTQWPAGHPRHAREVSPSELYFCEICSAKAPTV